MRFAWCMLLVLLFTTQVFAGDEYKKLNDKAADKYKQGEFDKARELLEEAKDDRPGDPVVNYNLGSVQHQEGNYEEAGESLLNASMAEDSAMRSHAYYNIGNTEYRKGDYQKAVDAYKKSLANNPDDLDAKYNLEVALKKLQEQQQQQSECDKQQDNENQDQENQDQQNQDQEQQDKQDEQQDQQQQDQQQQDQENQDQQDQQQQQQQEQEEQDDQQQQQSSGDQEGDEQQQQQQQQQVQQAEMSEEDAERLLNAVTGNDREVLQKLVKMKAPAGAYSGKDW